jgi:hypothetical protein
MEINKYKDRSVHKVNSTFAIFGPMLSQLSWHYIGPSQVRIVGIDLGSTT